jgi:hypothetical protein
MVTEADSSQTHAEGALLQSHMRNGQRVLHPIAHFSEKLTNIQTRYSTQERELLAIILCLQYWRHWIKNGNVIIIINHDSLKFLNTKAELLAKIVRFLSAIKNFGARIIYRFSKANVLADYLSRPPETAHAIIASEKGGITRLEEVNRMNL